jgi:hypothetical protein
MHPGAAGAIRDPAEDLIVSLEVFLMRYRPLSPFSLSLLAACAALSGCSGNVMTQSTISTPGTGPAPTVVAVGEQVNGVAPNRKQEVQFSEAMDAATVNAQSFQVTDSSGKMVQGVVSYDSDFNTTGFLPNPALQANATYTATITTAAASAGGVHLASPYSYTFSTRGDSDTSPLIVTSVSPAVGATCVSATTPIIITFDEAPDASMLTAADLSVSGPSGGITVKISTNITTTQVVLTPTSPLPTGDITVKVQNVGDLAGAMMTAPYTWSFSTACGGGGSASGKEYIYFSSPVIGAPPQFYAYAIDDSTGKLTPVPGMPFQANLANPGPCGNGCFLTPLADPLGRFLFYNFSWPVTQRGVGSMKVNPSTGSLDGAGTLIASDPIISNISADPQGRFVYGTGSTSAPGPYGNNWIVSMVVGSNGQLSFAPEGPYAYPEGNGGGDIPAPAASTEFLFAADPHNYLNGSDLPSRMFTFKLNQSTGAMGPVQNIADGTSAGEQVITPSGKFLYSETHAILSSGLEGARELAGFRVNNDGSLTPISPGPLPLPANDFGIQTLTMSPNGNFLYVSSMHTTINPGVSTGTTVEIQAFAIDQNTGALSQTADYTSTAGQPNAPSATLVIDPSVKYVYFTEATSSTQVSLVGMNVDPKTGALSPISGVQNWPVLSAPTTTLAIVRPQ